ncbi:peptide-methionine (S)-S-oxide reductase MsrA [Flavihumibacter sp. R14]|nr:peptide-methionine (S)-S-oxide reductase MsrA [Flavihumibacter soli]
MNTETAIFASGCFWGTEYYFRKAEGVISTAVGYIGGSTENPSYEEVCSGLTGHAEATEITYDPAKTSYENLVKLFYETHDPGQMDGQGPDIGSQYRSGIFYLNDKQKEIAKRVTEQLKAKGYPVVTELTKAGPFYKAENYHQNYYGNGGGTPYCHSYEKKF